MDIRNKEAFLKARATEVKAEAALATARQNLAKIKTAKDLVAHAKGKWIGGADQGIAAAKEQLKHATTDAERQTAENELAKWTKNREDGVAALQQRQALWEQAERDRPRAEQELKAAEKRLVEAKSRGMATVKSLDSSPFYPTTSWMPGWLDIPLYWRPRRGGWRHFPSRAEHTTRWSIRCWPMIIC